MEYERYIASVLCGLLIFLLLIPPVMRWFTSWIPNGYVYAITLGFLIAAIVYIVIYSLYPKPPV